jgi:hypothetical protein
VRVPGWIVALFLSLGVASEGAGQNRAPESMAVAAPTGIASTRRDGMPGDSPHPWLKQGRQTNGVPRAPIIALGRSGGPRPATPVARARQSWWPPLASAVLPGAGQAMLGQDRALAYIAVEGYGWLRYASDVREGQRQRSAYRALAARVARAYLSDDSPVGDFEYYERMEHYVESGVFDTSSEEGLQPETNPESFNGFIWLRARTTYWEDPAIPPSPASQQYFAALEYYADRAIQPAYRWSWRNAQLEQDIFRRTIERSNDAFRRSIQDLGVIIANHALSTVDAYVTVRIRHAREAEGGVGVEAVVPWSPRSPFRGKQR